MSPRVQIALALLVTACAEDAGGDPQVEWVDGYEMEAVPGGGPRVPAIYGGSAPNAPEHAAVVSLHEVEDMGNGQKAVYVQPFCSGTLVSGSVVVSAAHCVDVASGGAAFQTISPAEVAVYVGNAPSVDLLQHLYLVTEVRIHPDYNRTLIRNDLSLLRLSQLVAEAVTPVPPLPASLGFKKADTGIALNLAGFGLTKTGSSGVKLQTNVKLEGLGCAVRGCPNAGDAATQISYAQKTSGACFGDSGGPTFVKRSGTTYLGGVISYGDSSCVKYGVSTRVDAYGPFISAFIGP